MRTWWVTERLASQAPQAGSLLVGVEAAVEQVLLWGQALAAEGAARTAPQAEGAILSLPCRQRPRQKYTTPTSGCARDVAADVDDLWWL